MRFITMSTFCFAIMTSSVSACSTASFVSFYNTPYQDKQDGFAYFIGEVIKLSEETRTVTIKVFQSYNDLMGINNNDVIVTEYEQPGPCSGINHGWAGNVSVYGVKKIGEKLILKSSSSGLW